jgi:nucleoside-diphosphate-sugar epimerase
MSNSINSLIAITGASGFVGSNLTSFLQNLGIQCRQLSRRKHFDGYTIQTINSLTDWSTVLSNVDVVIHCASRVLVLHDHVADPLTAYRSVNVAGTRRLAFQAAELGVKRLVFLSSIKVNGECTRSGEFFNSRSPAAPLDPYGISKFEAEQALHQVSVQTGLEVVIVRPPLVYGPGVRANFLRLLRLVQRQIPLPLGAVHNQRSLIYVGNLVSFLAACALQPAAAGRTLLIADAEPLSTPELVQQLALALKTKPRVIPVTPSLLSLLGRLSGKQAEFSRLTGSLVIDPSEAFQTLNWQPPFSTAEGLQITADWFLASQKEAVAQSIP